MELTMMWAANAIIAWYLFLAGLSAGAFLTSVYVEKKHPERTKFLLVTRIVAFIALVVGLILLMADAPGGLKNPIAFFFLLSNLKSSVMSWGVIFLAVLAIVQFLYVVYEILRGKDNWFTRLFEKLQGVLEILGIIFAIATAAYTGLLIGVVKTVPLWNNALLPILFFVSAVSSGIAASLVFSGLVKRSDIEGMHGLTKIHVSAIIVEIALLAAMLFIVNSGNAAGHKSVVALVAGEYALLFWVFIAVLGLIVPMIYELWELKSGKGSAIATIVIEILVMVGGFMLRYLIIKASVPIDFIGF